MKGLVLALMGVAMIASGAQAQTGRHPTASAKWKTDHVNFSVGFAIGII